MLIRWTVWLTTSLVLFSGVFCDTYEKFFSGNLKDNENTFLEDEYAGPVSQAFSRRVQRATPPAVSISPTSLNLVKGESGGVTCSGDSNDLVWLGTDTKKLKPNDHIKIDTDKKQNRTTLTFSSVKQTRSGRYFCANQKSNKLANFTLTVYEKPKTKITSSQKTYEVGDNFTLICEAHSRNISWYSGANRIPSNEQGKNPVFSGAVKVGFKSTSSLALTFKNVSTAQSGEYKCSSKVLNVEKTDSISIKVSPAKLTFSPDKDDKSIKENEDYSVSCGGRVTQIWWTRDGKIISPNHAGDENVYVDTKKPDEQNLHFESAEKFNEGEYICYGYSTFNGQLLQKSFRLRVIEDNLLGKPIVRSRNPPMSNNIAKVKLHSNFTAACVGETADIEWLGPPYFWKIPERSLIDIPIYTEPVPLFKKRLLLRFKNVTLNDEGQYKCKVTKKGQKTLETTAEFNLTVYIPIEFNYTPIHYSVNETADVKLECAVTGRPKPQVTWLNRHGKRIINETGFSYDGDSLVITNVSYHHAGNYICQAQQPSIDGVTRDRAVALQVFHKPYFSARRKEIESLRNQTSFLTCEPDADPAAVYTWYQNSSVLILPSGLPARNLQNSTIEVLLLNNTDSEAFVCVANNSYGGSAQIVSIKAMQIPDYPDVKILNFTENEIMFQIIADRNESITDFNIEYREMSSSEWSDKNETKPDSNFHVFVLDELQPKTIYIIRARAINPIGAGAYSAEMWVTTKASLANQLTASTGVLFAVILTLYSLEFL